MVLLEAREQKDLMSSLPVSILKVCRWVGRQVGQVDGWWVGGVQMVGVGEEWVDVCRW